MTYYKTRDLFYVKYALGHRNINNTLIYVHLAEQLYPKSDEWTHGIAKTIDEACRLIDIGFEYATEMNGAKILRKRK
ncbi:MAG: hypothetical protein AOA65_0644 [Candidatus Bathyarchaeota archaeon BA1]|nr:MAG: hypothetical protein AOA65_0644 [Candidatus Bathyarchaeota archaeon BA1]